MDSFILICLILMHVLSVRLKMDVKVACLLKVHLTFRRIVLLQ